MVLTEGSTLVDALRQVFVGQLLGALDLDQQTTGHDQIGRVRADMLPW